MLYEVITNLENFKNGTLNLEIRGDSRAVFLLGYQTGKYALGNQVGNYVTFGPGEKYSLGKGWKKYLGCEGQRVGRFSLKVMKSSI